MPPIIKRVTTKPIVYLASVSFSFSQGLEVESSKTSFEVLGLDLKAQVPWPWPRTLQVLENVLSSARGQHCFLIG